RARGRAVGGWAPVVRFLLRGGEREAAHAAARPETHRDRAGYAGRAREDRRGGVSGGGHRERRPYRRDGARGGRRPAATTPRGLQGAGGLWRERAPRASPRRPPRP